MNRTDQNLIADYLSGDEEAFKILVNRYLKQIYSFIYRYVGNAPDAEDITQEVFIKAWRHLKSFDPRRSRYATLGGQREKKLAPHRTCSDAGFKTWIFSIAKNTAIDFLRKKKAIPFSEFETSDSEDALTATIVDPAPLPSEIVEREDIKQILVSAMEKLSPQYRTVLYLHYNDHFTFREIAEILGEPLNTIKSRHRRGLIMLKKLLAETS